MNKNNFMDYSQNKIIQTIIECDGEYYPNNATLMHPFCFCTFEENFITITPCEHLIIKKEKKSFTHIKPSDIKSVELSLSRKTILVSLMTAKLIDFSVVINLIDGKHIQFESEDITPAPLIINYFERNNIPIKDTFDLKRMFECKKSAKDVYKYLGYNFDRISEEKTTSNKYIF